MRDNARQRQHTPTPSLFYSPSKRSFALSFQTLRCRMCNTSYDRCSRLNCLRDIETCSVLGRRPLNYSTHRKRDQMGRSLCRLSIESSNDSVKLLDTRHIVTTSPQAISLEDNQEIFNISKPIGCQINSCLAHGGLMLFQTFVEFQR